MSLEEGADRILGQCLAVRKGECVLIIVDTDKTKIGEALFEAVRKSEAQPIMTLMNPPEPDNVEPPEPLTRLMLECDSVIIATSKSMTHTKARMRATKAGVRIVSLPGVTEEMMANGGITADFKEISRLLTILRRKLRNTKKVHVTSSGGTDASFSIKGRDWITEDNGLATHRGDFTTLPAGEVFIAPIEGTGEGRIVFDVRLEDLLEEPATTVLKEGYVSKVMGARAAVAAMNKGGKDGRNFAKVGIGLNPNSRSKGPVVEAQKALGVLHVVFGGNSAFGGKVKCDVRVDGIMMEPTVDVDGKVIVEKGKLTF